MSLRSLRSTALAHPLDYRIKDRYEREPEDRCGQHAADHRRADRLPAGGPRALIASGIASSFGRTAAMMREALSPAPRCSHGFKMANAAAALD